MSIFSSPDEANLGSLNIEPLLPCPPLPNIVSEWAAILPLVCHLAGQRDDYNTSGDVALMGRLSVGLFPRLGTLSGLARLLDRATKYLDYASTRGGTSRTVWDVKWGSVFPCANGAACAVISEFLLTRDRKPPQRMPETLSSLSEKSDGDEKCTPQSRFRIRPVISSFSSGLRRSTLKAEKVNEEGFRRCQLLHVYRLYRKPKRHSLGDQITQLRLSIPGQLVCFVILIGLAVLLCLFGCFGSATLIACTSVSELVAMRVPIRRPSTYLQNNEAHDACMLTAPHENATEWHLYIGDRGIVDTLLNKPMFVVPEGRSAHLAARWFWFANVLQLAAMTFVAAQKGWDGVLMLALLAIHWALRWFSSGQDLARDWLAREGIDGDVRSFEFGGRYAMMGGIQVLSGSTATRWMDTILAPHPRREAWLKVLRGEESTESFGNHDASWLEYMSEASFASAQVLKSTFGVVNCQASV
ncbi:Herpesvirus glycoprotein N [Apiospora arundinis]|uniref:Herpesvirus glycoprotein N n=1 Tax=Apiospora arundinis TaxID=335852 RepID=A0ABR2HPI9_9PEZI